MMEFQQHLKSPLLVKVRNGLIFQFINWNMILLRVLPSEINVQLQGPLLPEHIYSCQRNNW